MPGRSVLQWDKDDCAAIGLVKFDLLGLGMLEALHRMVDLVRDFHGVDGRPGAAAPGGRGLRPVVPGRHGRGLPGREPGPDGDPAPGAAAHLLRHRHRGRAHPARPHSGPRGEPLHPAAPGRGAGHLPAPAARADPQAHARGPALPGAADGDGRGHRRVQRRRRRRAAPGHGGQALGGAHGEDAGPAVRGDGGARRDGRGGRPGLRGAGRLRQLRLPRVALGVVRASRLLLGLVEAALPGGVHRGVAQLAAHGLLVAPVAGGRRAPPRGARAPAPREPLRGGGVAGGACRRTRCCGWGWGRCAGWARRRRSGSWPAAPGAGARTWCGGPASPRPSSRRWPPPARSTPRAPGTRTGTGRCRGRRPAGAGCCGRPGRRRRGRRTACPGSWWGPRHRRCPSPASTTRWATTCGPSGWRRSGRPCIWPASGSRRWAW